jgi:hypothetical protein
MPHETTTRIGVFCALVLCGGGAPVWADAQQTARCAGRVSIAITGKSPDATLMAATNPQASVDTLLAGADFIDRFSRFINAQFNDDPAQMPSQDSAYFLAKQILMTNAPWKNMFVGQFNVDVAAGQPAGSNNVVVTADPNGLGYFRSLPWLHRYEGNEPAGIKIVTAYRIMNNIIGLKLMAVTNAPGTDISATGRMAMPCAQCHYQGPFALDVVARALTKRVGNGNNATFQAQNLGPQAVLNTMVADDAGLVNTLVSSDSFKFRACRLAFLYLYGRAENQCEAPVFDQCVQAFTQAGTIQSALATVAKDPSFCQ